MRAGRRADFCTQAVGWYAYFNRLGQVLRGSRQTMRSRSDGIRASLRDNITPYP